MNRPRPSQPGPGARRRASFRPASEGVAGPLVVSCLTRALARLVRFDAPADLIMRGFFRGEPKLGPRERGVIAETAFYALRHLASLSWRMRPAKPVSEPRRLALLALLSRYGARALAQPALREEATPLFRALADSLERAPRHVRHELPQWMYDRLLAQYGPEETELLAEFCARSAPLDLRVNVLRTTREDVLRQLTERGLRAAVTTLSPDGVRLADKPALTGWPLYRDGLIEVQDEGSQLLARLVAPKRGEMVCDFCAGAGGKTLALGALMRSTGRLYAFDISERRLSALSDRVGRAGLSDVHPIRLSDERDPRLKRLRGKFDRVLVDAPCSGSGTLRRNPDLRWRVSPAEVDRLVERQRAILTEAARLLRPGGRLVYATCSLLARENQENIAWFLEQRRDFTLLDASAILAGQGIDHPPELVTRFAPHFVLLPHISLTDGFYGAVMELGADA